jgi:putative copper resistance protein D
MDAMTPLVPRARAGPIRRALAGFGALVGLAALPAAALAHGLAPAEPPTVAGLLFDWSFEPVVLLPVAMATVGWIVAVRRVNGAHPGNPVPRRRTASFLLGMAAIAFALMSGIDRYDTTLFSIHMVQHLLLMVVAAPLIALAAPITLALRLATPDVRRSILLPALHSRVAKVLAFPVFAWLQFAIVLWAAHLSPLFDAALESEPLHVVEHGLFLASALLFWWPAVALDPSPWRMPYPVRSLYVFLQAPQNTFLAVLLVTAPVSIYQHYAAVIRAWGPSALVDQGIAGGIMWIVGDVVFIGGALAIFAGWMRHEERATARAERRADAQRAAIREREARLAERLAAERAAPDG